MPDKQNPVPNKDDFFHALRSVQTTTSRPLLNVIFLLDISGSMRADGKITSINNMMRELPLTLLREANDKKLQLKMRVITFASTAQFVLGSVEEGIEVDDNYEWNDVSVGLKTATASAISLAAECLHQKYLGKNNRTPIIFLITDGECTQPDKSYSQAIVEISKRLSGKSIRVAIAIGNEYNKEELKKFASIGKRQNLEGDVCNEHYIYTVAQKEDIAKIITEITSIMMSQSSGTRMLI